MIIDEFSFCIIFEILIFKSYKAFYNVCLRLLLYAKFIVICVNDKCWIYWCLFFYIKIFKYVFNVWFFFWLFVCEWKVVNMLFWILKYFLSFLWNVKMNNLSRFVILCFETSWFEKIFLINKCVNCSVVIVDWYNINLTYLIKLFIIVAIIS